MNTPALLRIEASVLAQIRAHAATSLAAEICGVLLGTPDSGVTAAIAGSDAVEAGTHVTFTHQTWQHIYSVKDTSYPDLAILGWYHSHPGFGVFLSDHDTFIHQNFFSAPHQLAWVVDPVSGEEAAFGWCDEQIVRLPQLLIVDSLQPSANGGPEPVLAPASSASQPAAAQIATQDDSPLRLVDLLLNLVLYASFFLLGAGCCYLFYPRLVGIPVDPRTGQPLVQDLAPSAAPGKGTQ